MMSFASPIFFFMTLFSLSIAEVVSMDSVSDFNDLRSCGNYCFGYRSPGFRLDTLAQVLSCDSNEVIENSCFCRADLQDTGVKHLSTCVSSSCSGNMVDVAAATQLYKDYCTSAGYTAAPRTVKAQSTGGITIIKLQMRVRKLIYSRDNARHCNNASYCNSERRQWYPDRNGPAFITDRVLEH
jgi:hypothetical protein